jgi:hypothetical protein
MPIQGEQSAEHALAAMLRGVGEFGHHARATVRRGTIRLAWL